MNHKKTKVFWYKEGCSPRILINPDKEAIDLCREEGIVLINPNEGSVKGLPLEHTFPDVENNLLRPVPAHLRKNLNSFKNPVAAVQRKGDKELLQAMKYIRGIKDLELSYKYDVLQELKESEHKLKKSIVYNRLGMGIMFLIGSLLFVLRDLL